MFIFLPLYGQISDFRQYSSPNIESTVKYIDGNIYQKDFLLFIDMLTKCHPAFVPDSNAQYPFDIESIKQKGYYWAETCPSLKDFWCYIQGIVILLHDSHTTLVPDINTNLIYPVTFFVNNGLDRLYIMGINVEYIHALGKEIKLINGCPVNEVFNCFKKLISCDNDTYFKNKITDFMQLYSIWNYTTYCLPDSSLLLTLTDSTNVLIHPLNKDNVNITMQISKTKHELIRKSNNVPFHYTIIPEKNLCYFQFNSCTDQSTLRLQYLLSNPNISENDLTEKVSIYQRFDTFLNDMFKQIRIYHIETLVIDIRNNVGGNSKLCEVLLSWLKPVNETKNIHSYTRFSELWQESYPVLADDYFQALKKIHQPFHMGKIYDDNLLSSYLSASSTVKKTDEYFQKNYDDNLIFKGNIIFVQNSKTYSSAGFLITTAFDNNIGIVIGDKSSYKPCNYGDMLAWRLPNTKIKGYVSHKIFKRPNINKCYENYLLPTFYLSPNWTDVIEGKDIYWEWILKNNNKQ
jgi:IS1 family transposase